MNLLRLSVFTVYAFFSTYAGVYLLSMASLQYSSFVFWLKTTVGGLENVILETKINIPAKTQISRALRDRGLAGLTYLVK